MQRVSWWMLLAVFGISSSAWAQSIGIGNNRGPSNTHFNLPSNTGNFTYDGWCEATHDFELTLRVKRLGITLYTNTVTVINPPAHYDYSTSMDMSAWNLVVGQVIIFDLRGRLIPYPSIRDTDFLYGDVTNPIGFESDDTPWHQLIAALPPRREDLFEDLA